MVAIIPGLTQQQAYNGITTAANSAIASKPSLSSNPRYLVELQTFDGSISVVANTPENIGFQIQNQWEPFISSFINIGVLGLSFVPQAFTMQLWRGSSPFEIELPLHFNAYNDEVQEVCLPLRNLVMLAAPYYVNGSGGAVGAIESGLTSIGTSAIPGFSGFGNTILHAPGPTYSDWYNGGAKTSDSSSQISLVIGSAFYLSSVVISELRIEWDSRYSIRGNPIAAIATVRVISDYVLARADYIDALFPGAK